MQSSSARFAEAIVNGYTLSTNVLLKEPSGTLSELGILDGSVTRDGTAATRTAITLDLPPDPDLVPNLPGDPLAPYWNELHVSRGIEFPDGTVEEIPLGVFMLDETSVDDPGDDLPIQVSALDRSQRVIDAVMEEPGQIASGTLCTDAIEALISEVLPDAEFDFSDSDVTLPLLSYAQGDDRWDLCQGIAEATQSDLYFDARGICVMRAHPETDVADLVISEGEGGVLCSASKRWSRADACNRVVVSGESSGSDPVIGVAIDDDPLSPTRYGGPFGRITFPWSSEYVTDTAQAEAVAGRILSLKRGTGQQIGFGSLVDPRLEPFDIVHVRRERLGIDALYIVDSIQLPLTEAKMSAETRTARVF